MQKSNLNRVGVLGFAFKAGTSDTRSTSAALFCATLVMQGYKVTVTDPKVQEESFKWEMAIQGFESLIPLVNFRGSDLENTVKESEALLVLTEWPEYKQLDYVKIRSLMPTPTALFFDLRSFLE